MTITRPLRALAAAAAALLAACTLADVTVPAGEDRVVVEAVLRTDLARQAVLLHRTVEGREVRGVPGARVVVRDEDTGAEVAFAESGSECYATDPRYFATDSITVAATCHASPAAAGRWVRPGGTYALRVDLPGGGGTVRGRLRVPDAFALAGLPFSAAAPADSAPRCVLPPATALPVAWSRAGGARGYLASMRLLGLPAALASSGVEEVPDTLDLTGVAVSETDTTLLVPTEVGVFDRFDLDPRLLLAIRDGLPAGTDVRLVVSAADRNYVNGVRGGPFNPSGQVRISSVTGGGAVGVFGALVPLSLRIRVGEVGAGEVSCLP